MSKRGLSTIITTLIMILLTLVAVGMIWLVVMNILKSSAEDINIGKFTIDLDIKSVQIDNNNVMIKIKRNVGAGEISGLKFAVSDGFNISVYEETTNIKELEEKTYILNYDGGLVKSVSIAPILKTSSGKEKTGNIIAEKEFSNYDVVKNIPGLVSWWRFEGNANDEIGENDGTLTNGVDCNVQGKYGKACEFDAIDDYVDVGNDVSLSIGFSDQTYEGWFKTAAKQTSTYTALVERYGSISRFNLGFGTNGQVIAFLVDVNGNSAVAISPTAYDDDKWHHIAMVRTPTTLTLYVDGVAVVTKDATSVTNVTVPYPVNIGQWAGRFFNGTIDEVMIFNRALSVNEVKAIYNLDLS